MCKSADLPEEIIQKHQIEIIPFKSDWPEAEGLPGENIYQVQREAERRGIKTFAKTSQPSPKIFLDAYRKMLEKFKEVLCITLTSKLSGTYNSATQAKNFLKPEEKERVFLVDSLNVSGGEALLAFKAFDLMKEKEKTAKKIKDILENLRSKVFLRVALNDVKWVEAAGRVPSVVANWVRRMQKAGIYPLLGFKGGILKPVTIRFGSKDLPTILFNEIKNKTKKLRNKNQEIRVVVVHADSKEAAQRLKKMVEKELKGVHVLFVNLVSNIIGNLVGPDSLGIVWVQD